MFVESHDRFDDVGDLDPESGHLVEFSRSARSSSDLPAGPVCGHYARLDDDLAVFYRAGESLWLRAGEHVRELETGRSSVRWEGLGERSRLTLRDEDNYVVSVGYRVGPTRGPSLVDDPTLFSAIENWDFGLFVRNVLMDDGRRGRIYSGDPAGRRRALRRGVAGSGT